MRPQVWRIVVVTAATLVLLSWWPRLPSDLRWVVAGVMALVPVGAVLIPTRRMRAQEETPRSPRRGRAGSLFTGRRKAMARDAVRFLERIDGRAGPGPTSGAAGVADPRGRIFRERGRGAGGSIPQTVPPQQIGGRRTPRNRSGTALAEFARQAPKV